MFFKKCSSIIKKSESLFFIFIVFTWALLASVTDTIKTRNIRIDPNLSFGKDNPSNLQFNTWELSMDISDEGDIFVCNAQEHCIYRFDAQGNRLIVFGRKGEGPGDLLYPHDIEIFGKYLLVADQPNRCKLTCFNLDGNLIKVYSTKHPVYKVAWVSRSTVFYSSNQVKIDEKSKKRISRLIVYRLDLEKQLEKEIVAFEIPAMEVLIEAGGKILNISLPGHPYGDIHITATPHGTIFVGCSNEKKIKEIDENGNTLSIYEYPFPFREFPSEISEKFYNGMRLPRVDKATNDKFRSKLRREVKFPRFMPFYHSFWMDKKGNLYVFLKTGCLKECPEECRIFSPGLKLKSKWELAAPENLTMDFNSWDSNDFFRVFNESVFMLVEEILKDDSIVRLIRMVQK